MRGVVVQNLGIGVSDWWSVGCILRYIVLYLVEYLTCRRFSFVVNRLPQDTILNSGKLMMLKWVTGQVLYLSFFPFFLCGCLIYYC